MVEKYKNSFIGIFLKKLSKRIRLKTLLLLAILLSSNSFAWFLYATRVSNNITAYVKSWNVDFIVGDNNVEETIVFDVESIYPGMEESFQQIHATNNGDTAAKLEYKVESATILGQKYTLSENLTNEELLEMLENDFPFSLTITSSNDFMDAYSGEATIDFRLTWPYESGDDELDTLWGHKAYSFNKNNPDEKSIKLVIKVMATQIEE